MTVERVYALTRLGRGDYLLPSNDGLTLWRIHAYYEDGSASLVWVDDDGEHERVIRGTYWAASRWRGSIAEAEALATRDPDDFLGWDDRLWNVHYYSTHKTRQEAIESALSAPG